MNLRTSLEAIVKTKNMRTEPKFSFGGRVWATPIVKKFLESFKGQDVVVTTGVRSEKPALIFKWHNGDAFVLPYEGKAAEIEC